MATVIVSFDKVAGQSPGTFLVRRSLRKSILSGSRRLQGSWNFSDVAQGLTLSITALELRERNRRRIIIRANNERSRDGGSWANRRPHLKFDSADMMELEFGRLLGEDRQTTLAKVIGKKTNPDVNYVKIEKGKELHERKEAARRSSPSKFSAPVRPDFKLKEKANDHSNQTCEPGVPDLISPPIRPPGFEKVDASPGRTIRVAPLVLSGGRKESADSNPYELEGLVRKPMRVSEAEKGLPPARPDKAIIAPMLMRKGIRSVEIHPKAEDNLLRRPSAVGLNPLGEPLTSDKIPTSLSDEEIQSADDVDPDDMSNERFRLLLDGELSLRHKGRQRTISKTCMLEMVPPPVRSVFPGSEKNPSILGKPQLVDSRGNLIIKPANRTSSTDAERGPGPENAEVPSPQPEMSSSFRAKLCKPSLVRPQTNFEGKVVNEVPSDKNEENIVEAVQTKDLNSLEESAFKVQGAEASPDNISGEDPEEDNKEDTGLLHVVKPEGEYMLEGKVDVQGSGKKEGMSEAVARKPVIRLRKTSLPLQQPALSSQYRSLLYSTSQDSSSAQETNVEDHATSASDPASGRREYEGLVMREQVVKGEQESMLPKTRQLAPGLKLSRPASPASFTWKKDAQVDTTLNNLQKAISSFDERRILINKKEKDEDWARAEALRDSKAVEEVEIVGTRMGGFLVGFGSLVGYLAAFELKGERRPVSFTVWAQSRGYDAKTKTFIQDEDQGRLTTSSMELATSSIAQDTGGLVDALEQRSSKAVDPELLEQFKKERAAALSLLVGQKAKVVVTSVDRTLRQLRFSEKQAEGEGQELSQKKITLMESLNVGDVVTCQVKKITTFGAFVDLQGVPALIHSSELSWNRNTDSLSVLQVGQEVKAKVCKLDRFLQRINLSVKLMQPDPLLETLESLVSPDADMTGAPADAECRVEEYQELNTFIRKLEQIPDIAAVSCWRRVRGAALAPAFQIYLSGPLDNGYKMLARFGNEVQEVIVETSADRERMKDLIRDCMVQDS